MQLPALIVGVYAVLDIVGGVLGYVSKKSVPSLVAGTVTGVILLAAAWGVSQKQSWGLPVAIVVIGLLLAFFGYRFKSTKNFMPTGLMTILSLATLLGLALMVPW